MAVKKFFFVCIAACFIFLFNACAFAAKPAAVSYTAPINLYWLSKAGVPEAVEYVKYINAERILKSEKISQYERVEKANKIYQEIRYNSLNDFIDSENYKNVIDLGCGVSPRFLYTTKKGINYVGVELPEVVKVLNIYAPNFLDEDMRKYVRFVAADVANRDEIIKAAEECEGEVCIVEEDLLSYLPRDKQKAMLENIREILKEKGGCFVTSDFVDGDIFMSCCETLYDEDALTVAKETQKVYEEIAEMFFDENLFDSTEEAVKLIEDAGLKVEMRPLFKNTPDIISIRDLNNKDISRIKEMTKQKLLWIITVDERK